MFINYEILLANKRRIFNWDSNPTETISFIHFFFNFFNLRTTVVAHFGDETLGSKNKTFYSQKPVSWGLRRWLWVLSREVKTI